MRNLSPIDESKDIITKEYIDYRFADSGISGITYTTVLDETEVTTASISDFPNPYALLATSFDSDRGNRFRITVDGVEYILTCYGWFHIRSGGSGSKSNNIIGNLSYIGESGAYFDVDNVPFLIVHGILDEISSATQLYFFSETVGTYTVKIELINYDLTNIPAYLLYGKDITPVTVYPVSGYNSYNIGSNKFQTNKRGNIGIGDANQLLGNSAMAWGLMNIASGQYSLAIGLNNQTTGNYSYAYGYGNQSSAQLSTSIGAGCKASGTGSFAEGYQAEARGTRSHATGNNTIATHKSQHVLGEFNATDDSSSAATARGNYVEIVGNGTDANNRSNARTLDWSGNESIAGSLTLGMGSNDQITITAAQLNQLLNLSASIPAQSSIDNSGLISFKNSSGETLFTLQLPIYGGIVSNYFDGSVTIQ